MPDTELQARPRPARCIKILCTLAVLAFAATIGAGLIGSVSPALDLVSHFQVHLFIGGLLLAALCLQLRARRHALLALALCTVPVVRIAPYWIPGPSLAIPPDSQHLIVMTANVRTQNEQHREFMDEVRRQDPDVLAIIEVSTRWENELAPLIAEYPYQHQTRIPGDTRYGVMILSRLPLTPKPLPLAFRESYFRCAAAEVHSDAGDILLLAPHPMPPTGFGATRLRDLQLGLANEFVRTHTTDHTIVMGDLNATPWSHGYRTMTEGTTLRNTRLGAGMRNSWPSFLPEFMQIPIDHILVSENIDVRYAAVGADIGSDHLPVISSLIVRAPDEP